MDNKTHQELYDYMNHTAMEIDEYIIRHLVKLRKEDKKLYDVVSHLIALRKGKPKLRATFGRLIYETFSNSNWHKILPLLAFMELSTIATYVLDDIIDDQPEREARVATWRKFGLNYGIVGGSLQTFISIQMLFDLELKEKIKLKILSKAIEMWEVLWEGEGENEHMKKSTTINKYLERCYKLCAVMFESVAKMSAMAAGAKKGEIIFAEELGKIFGMAVMIRNDLTIFLPENIMRARSTALSRRSFEDVRKGIWTYPIICVMKKGTQEEKFSINSLLGKKEAKEKELLGITKILFRTGCIEDSLDMISFYKQKALDYANRVKKKKQKELFIELFQILENTRIYIKDYKSSIKN